MHYDHDEVYNYCLGAIEPEKKSDSSGSYYEFDIFICSNVYQDATMAYTPDSKELDDLGGSGSGDSCPYASE